MSLTLRQLEIFHTVAKLGHVTKSSEVLGISQSAISMSLQELEKTLHVKLFERIGRALVLNESGRLLYEQSFEILEKAQSIEDSFVNQKTSGHLIIGASQTVANYVLPLIIYQFNKLHPQAKIELKIGNTQEIALMITEGSIDVGFVEGSVNDRSITKEFWKKDQLCVVTHPQTKLSKSSYALKDLASKEWIVREKGSGTRRFFEDILEQQKLVIENELEIGGFSAIKEIVTRQVETFAVISDVAITRELDQKTLKVVPLSEQQELVREFSILTYKEKFKSKLYTEFVSYAKLC